MDNFNIRDNPGAFYGLMGQPRPIRSTNMGKNFIKACADHIKKGDYTVTYGDGHQTVYSNHTALESSKDKQ